MSDPKQHADTGNWENVFTQQHAKTRTTHNKLMLQIDDIQLHKGRVGNSVLLKINDVVLSCELAEPEDVELFGYSWETHPKGKIRYL